MFRQHLSSALSQLKQRPTVHSYCLRAVQKARAIPSLRRQFVRGLSPLRRCLLTGRKESNGDQWHTSRSLVQSRRNTYSASNSSISTNVVYQGPLSRAFRSLKIFSLTSLGLASALTPFMFVIDTSLPNIARAALAITAMSTSGISTALVGWCGQPYVTTIRTLGVSQDSAVKNSSGPQEAQTTSPLEGIQLETLSLTLKPRFTSVYDTSFLSETKRPMAKWELAESVVVPQNPTEIGPGVPSEETIAETMDAQGRVLGRWIVSWNEDGTKGVCRGEGKIQKYVNASLHT